MAAFEGGQFDGSLDHRGHLRLAYIYLVEHGVSEATDLIRAAITNFLQSRKIDQSKYHETVTRAWMLAVRHFMEKTSPSDSSDAFLAKNPRILDSKLMLTRYSAALLSTDEARKTFVEPDLDPIPTYDADRK